MKHGELKEYIAAGTTKEDFLRRISNAFSAGATAPAPSTPAASSEAAAAVPTPNARSPAAGESMPSGSPESDGSETVRRVLAERAAKAQKEAAARQAKVEAEAQSQAQVASSAKGKEKAPLNSSTPPPQTEAQREASELLRKKKAQQNDERQRILKRIEGDKESRRLEAIQREKQRQENRAAEEAEAQEKQQARAAARAVSSENATAAIQVRLTDGSTLRNKFKATDAVKDIRSWVDKDRSDGQGAYFFKQVLTPLPNKDIDATEERKPIRELGLSPSSTLLLIPIQRFAAAYEEPAASQGIFGKIIGLFLGIFTWILSLVGLGGQRPTEAQQESEATDAAAALRGQRMRAFQNSGDRLRDQQLYNGNSVRLFTVYAGEHALIISQLNFEPRPEEEEKKSG